MTTTRAPFDLHAAPVAAAPAPAFARAKRPSPGFTRFRINWGTRDGADARRVLAHVCRRGEIDSQSVGAITHEPLASTFDVADAVADSFAKRVRRRDRRDPHLFIEREQHGARHRASGRAFTASAR
jgi:ATP-dependent RNA helicase DeaD